MSIRHPDPYFLHLIKVDHRYDEAIRQSLRFEENSKKQGGQKPDRKMQEAFSRMLSAVPINSGCSRSEGVSTTEQQCLFVFDKIGFLPLRVGP